MKGERHFPVPEVMVTDRAVIFVVLNNFAINRIDLFPALGSAPGVLTKL
jgi:hypothetical protein